MKRALRGCPVDMAAVRFRCVKVPRPVYGIEEPTMLQGTTVSG